MNQQELNKESSVWHQDKEHFLHPWTLLDSFSEKGALAIESGDGVHIEDTEGNRYLGALCFIRDQIIVERDEKKVLKCWKYRYVRH